MLLGAHIGISGGVENSPGVARGLGCDVMQIFSKNQRQWRVSPISSEVARAFRESVRQEGIQSVVVHGSYLINMATPADDLKCKSREALFTELERAEALGALGVILHPGAHMGSGTENGLATIAEGAKQALERLGQAKVRLLFENAAGAGTTMGQTLEELEELWKRVDMPDRVGFCIDTCHLFASGWDFRTEAGYDALIEALDRTIGIKNILFFHLNDAKFPLGSHKDRHANIGNGEIGKEGFRRLLSDRRFSKVAGVLETPLTDDKENPYAQYGRDLKTLRGLCKESR